MVIYLMACVAMKSGRYILPFKRNLRSLSSLLCSENVSTRLSRNMDTYLRNYMMSHPRIFMFISVYRLQFEGHVLSLLSLI